MLKPALFIATLMTAGTGTAAAQNCLQDKFLYEAIARRDGPVVVPFETR